VTSTNLRRIFLCLTTIDSTNVYVADGSVFVTSGAHNPTNTIMAVALRNMRHLAGTSG
jgi:choline dehydrogenase-like flavoprotein